MFKCASYYDGTYTQEKFDKTMLATSGKDGLMSAEDKAKLDELTTGSGTEETQPSGPINAADVVVDETHRFVTDAEKASWNAKADTDTTYEVATASADGLMSIADKVKVDGIEEGANNYVHPATHAATEVVEDATHKFVTDEQIAAWDAKPEDKTAIGLGNVTDDAQVKRSEMGVADGVATLDASGLIPTSQLPGFVDDVFEADSMDAFPTTGESGKLYVDTTTNKTYRWSGTQYTPVGAGDLALGETAATAYAGDKGKAVTDAVNAIVDGTTIVPKAGNAATVGGFKVEQNVPVNAVFTDTVYTHPATHAATEIVEDEAHRFVADSQIAVWDAKPNKDTTYNAVTTATDGLMTAADKIKMDGIEEGANKYVHPVDVKHVTDEQIAAWDAKADTDTTYETVTAEADGLMIAADKAKLDAIPEFINTPYYDANLKSLFACGIPVIIEQSATEGMLVAKWVRAEGTGAGSRTTEFPAGSSVFGGGDGLTGAKFYPATCVTVNSGTVHAIYGGNNAAGSVGNATVVVNGGTIKYINGGGQGSVGKPMTEYDNVVGITNVIVNNTDNIVDLVYGGPQGLGIVGYAKLTINGGSMQWVTPAGSNGHTGEAEFIINGGNMVVAQGCNRGSVGNIKTTINGGTIERAYAGGETEDSGVTATYTKAEFNVLGGNIGAATVGSNGGVETADTVFGTYVEGVITDEAAAAANLVKAPIKFTDVVLEGSNLVFKNADGTAVKIIDLSVITA